MERNELAMRLDLLRAELQRQHNDGRAPWADSHDVDALLEAAVALGWRPIETAPKDGTWILIWPNDHVRPTVGCWLVTRNRWALSGWEQTPEIADAHWQPLPPPPKAAPSDQENGK